MLSSIEILSQVYEQLFFGPLSEASEAHRSVVEALATQVDAGSTTIVDAYAALVEDSKEVTGAIAAARLLLTGEMPTDAGMASLIDIEMAGDFGRFNVENRYINQFNALVQGNQQAVGRIKALLASDAADDGDLVASVINLYDAAVETYGAERDAAIAYLTRSDALAFYRGVAQERVMGGSNSAGLTLDQAAALVALGSIAAIAVRSGTPGIGGDIDGYLGGRAADTASSISFSGELADLYANGTAVIDDDVFVGSTAEEPSSVSVLGGADLSVTGDFETYGAGGSIVASGLGSTIGFEQVIVSARPGSEGLMTISHGASIETGDISFADRLVLSNDDGSVQGIVGGRAIAALDISNGGTLVVRGEAYFAAYYEREDDLNSGEETALATARVSGAGSKLTVAGEYTQFGTTKGGEASLLVEDGGLVELVYADFGNVDDDLGAGGGEGSLTIVGEGSSVLSQGVSFARGVDSIGDLVVADGGQLMATEYLSLADGGDTVAGTATALIQDGGTVETKYLGVGVNKGAATLTIDAGSVTVAGVYDDGFGAYANIGREGGKGSIIIINGGDMTIDGEHSLSPGFALGRDAGTGLIKIDGNGSTLKILGDAPDLLDEEGFSGEAYIPIGRGAGATGRLEVTNGGAFENTVMGFIDVGRSGGTGVLVVDGSGSKFDAGNGLRIGHDGGDGLVDIRNAASLWTSASLFDDQADIFVRDGGELRIAGMASIRGDISNEGAFLVDVTTSGSTLNGDLFQDETGMLTLDVKAAATTAGLMILGEIFLGGEIIVSVAETATLAAGDRVVLLEAAQNMSVDDELKVVFEGLSDTLDAHILFENDTAILVIGAANAFSDSYTVM